MAVHIDGKDYGDAKLLTVLRSVADTDTSVSPRAIAEAYEAVRDEPFFNPGKIAEAARAVTLRERRSAAIVDDEREPKLKARRSEGEARLAERTKEIGKELLPWIQDRRALLFGRADAPFPTLDAAARWIEEETRENLRLAALAPKPGREIDQLLRRQATADPWASYRLVAHRHLLHYWKTDGSPGIVQVSRQQQSLYGVLRAATEIADLTMLPVETAVAWILTGILPGGRVRLNDGRKVAMPGLRLASWTIRRPDGSDLPLGERAPLARRPRLILDLDIRDVTDRNLRVAVREARRRLEERAVPAITAKQRRVLEAVEQCGGPPTPTFARPFWIRIAKRLKLEDPIAVAKLYYRAVQASQPAGSQRIATDSKTERSKAAQVRVAVRKKARQSPPGAKRA